MLFFGILISHVLSRNYMFSAMSLIGQASFKWHSIEFFWNLDYYNKFSMLYYFHRRLFSIKDENYIEKLSRVTILFYVKNTEKEMLHIFYFKCQFLPHFLQVKCSILLLKKVELCDMSGLNNCYAIEYYKSKSPKEWKLCQKLSWILPFSRKCSE